MILTWMFLLSPAMGKSCSQTLETTDSLYTLHPDTDLDVLVVPCTGEELLTDPGEVVIYSQKQPRNSHKRALGGRPIK